MNTSLHLLLSGLLLVIWGTSVPLADLVQQRNAVPGWIKNIRLARLLSPAYYIVSIGTMAYFSVVPIMTHSLVVILLTLALIAAICNTVFGSRYETVRTTADGRALAVALFGILAAVILPIGILWFELT